MGSGKVEFVSAKNGSVVEKDVTGGLVIPANFEGYVILPTALFNTATGENFEAEALVPERFVLFALNPNWDQAEIQNKSYCIDDIGLVADVNAYTAMLSDLYQSDEPDNPGGDDEPGGDDTPDYTVTSSSGKVVIDGVMIRVAKGMTVREVLACLQVADSYTLVVVDRDGNEVTLDAPIAAGMRLKVMQEDLSVANYNFALTDAADIGTVTTSGEDDPGDSTKTGDTWPIGMLVLFGISMAATVALVSRRKPV